MTTERHPERLVTRITERERTQLARIREIIRECAVRLDELRDELVAARERSDDARAEVIVADHGTIALWLVWLREQEEDMVARLALLTTPVEDDT